MKEPSILDRVGHHDTAIISLGVVLLLSAKLFNPFLIGGVAFVFRTIASFTVILGFVVLFIIDTRSIELRYIPVILSLLVVLLTVSTIWSASPIETTLMIPDLILNLGLFFVVATAFYRFSIRELPYIFTLLNGATITIFGFFFLYFGGIRVDTLRATSLLFGLYAAICLPFVLLHIITRQNLPSILWYPIFLIDVLIIMISGSRTAVLMMIATIIIFVTFVQGTKQYSNRLYRMAGVSGIISLLAGGIGLSTPAGQRILVRGIETITTLAQGEASNLIRVEIWSTALRTIIIPKTFLGVGYGAFKTTWQIGLPAHNVIIDAWVGAGIIAALLITVGLTQVWRRFLWAMSQTTGSDQVIIASITASYGGLIIYLMFQGSVVGATTMWVFFAIATAFPAMVRNTSNASLK
ncbi:O-antigen ligase family protein [Halorubrum ezzemoulense]|uniref:O-antigen ligase family protein n=1 Tax=Halorubrum ezzemoulense TaxID=337243 RepID=UPI002330B7D3|nr:O-antigen ligase family protein [Halorubrum ezzemoulense]MDB9300324.1 O-antigen ligase family protein [Halorubrum ezzemoulense]